MVKTFIACLFSLIIFWQTTPIQAQTILYSTSSATVSATVPSFGEPQPPSVPLLISPASNSTVSSTTPTFIFDPSLTGTSVTHYQLWLDGSKNTDHIPSSTSTITTNALTSLNQGQHTWFIKAIGSNGTSQDSAIWAFTIDTTPPLILINQVAEHQTSISSNDLSSIPSDLSFTTQDRYPAITGLGEALATLTISFSNSTSSDTVTTTVKADKTFLVIPNISLPLGIYQVLVISSDAAGNTTNLPIFSIKITQATPPMITIPFPSPIPDLSFTLPFLPNPQLPQVPQEITMFPFQTSTPTIIIYLPWIIFCLYLLHIYFLNRLIFKHLQNNPIKPKLYFLIYITITSANIIWFYVALIYLHWLIIAFLIMSLTLQAIELKIIRSKHINKYHYRS